VDRDSVPTLEAVVNTSTFLDVAKVLQAGAAQRKADLGMAARAPLLILP
jgi:hypothetical protein